MTFLDSETVQWTGRWIDTYGVANNNLCKTVNFYDNS